MTASAAFGTYPATRSPGPTPMSRSLAATSPTCSRSIPQVSSRLTGPAPTDSLTSISATRSGSRPRNMCST
jgi:hypothetical protein